MSTVALSPTDFATAQQLTMRATRMTRLPVLGFLAQRCACGQRISVRAKAQIKDDDQWSVRPGAAPESLSLMPMSQVYVYNIDQLTGSDMPWLESTTAYGRREIAHPRSWRCTHCKRQLAPERDTIWHCTLSSPHGHIELDYTMGPAHEFTITPPSIEDLLENLIGDAASWVQSENVADFVDSMGYGEGYENVMRGTRIYDACGAIYRQLGDLLGGHGREQLMHDVVF